MEESASPPPQSISLGDLLRMGIEHHRAGRIGPAEQIYRQILSAVPDHAPTLHLLGLLARQAGFFDDAADWMRQAIAADPAKAAYSSTLGLTLIDAGDYEGAVQALQQAVEKADPADPLLDETWVKLGDAYYELEEVDASAQAYRSAAARRPAESAWNRLWNVSADCCLCPMVAASNDEIAEYRAKLSESLAKYTALEISADLTALAFHDIRPSFALPYHGLDDRPLREAFARLVQPMIGSEPPLPARSGEPKIGFVVTAGHEGGFARMMGRCLNAFRECHPVVIAPPSAESTLRKGLDEQRVRFHWLPAEITKARASIAAANYDVLYYPEIGTDAWNYLLPFCRLAPMQCTSWCIQSTSGIPAVDVYISSERFEAPEADRHYSERLVRFQTLLACMERTHRPHAPKSRDHFGLPGDRRVYLCMQHLGKFHPDFDAILAGILRHDPGGMIVIGAGNKPLALKKLVLRLRASMPDVIDRVHVMPMQQGDDYASLLLAADVLLDPIRFGGVNTTYDGLSLGKAIVAMPTEFQRGRFTTGCYQAMGIEGTIAKTPDEYVVNAVRLARDLEYRRHVEDAIASAREELFAHAKCAGELEGYLLKQIGR